MGSKKLIWTKVEAWKWVSGDGVAFYEVWVQARPRESAPQYAASYADERPWFGDTFTRGEALAACQAHADAKAHSLGFTPDFSEYREVEFRKNGVYGGAQYYDVYVGEVKTGALYREYAKAVGTASVGTASMAGHTPARHYWMFEPEANENETGMDALVKIGLSYPNDGRVWGYCPSHFDSAKAARLYLTPPLSLNKRYPTKKHGSPL